MWCHYHLYSERSHGCVCSWWCFLWVAEVQIWNSLRWRWSLHPCLERRDGCDRLLPQKKLNVFFFKETILIHTFEKKSMFSWIASVRSPWPPGSVQLQLRGGDGCTQAIPEWLGHCLNVIVNYDDAHCCSAECARVVVQFDLVSISTFALFYIIMMHDHTKLIFI